MWTDGASFLLSPAEKFLLLGNDETLAFFVVDREADITLLDDVGFDVFGVEYSGVFLGKGDVGFFFIPSKLLSVLDGII